VHVVPETLPGLPETGPPAPVAHYRSENPGWAAQVPIFRGESSIGVRPGQLHASEGPLAPLEGMVGAFKLRGVVAEWLNAAVLKTAEPVRVP
jgi:hypothetical protein